MIQGQIISLAYVKVIGYDVNDVAVGQVLAHVRKPEGGWVTTTEARRTLKREYGAHRTKTFQIWNIETVEA